jgi:hypothetical protein
MERDRNTATRNEREWNMKVNKNTGSIKISNSLFVKANGAIVRQTSRGVIETLASVEPKNIELAALVLKYLPLPQSGFGAKEMRKELVTARLAEHGI